MGTRRDFLRQTAAAGAVAALCSPSARPAQSGAAGRIKVPPVPRDGTVQTVLGPVDASKLGFTLPHEHLFASSAGFFQTWPEQFGGRASFTSKVVDHLKALRDEGVSTIVDVTPADIGRDIRFMQEVSRKSGIQIVPCTGHWLYPSLSMDARTVDELTEFFQREIERGIEGTDIKAGVIKVATDREGVTPFLDKALRAASRASIATGTPIIAHTNARERMGEKQAAIFAAEGLRSAAVCISHSDDSTDMGYLQGLLKRGYTLGMDHLTQGIGVADSRTGEAGDAASKAKPAQPAQQGPQSWQKRAECVKQLIDAGFVRQLFLSNDWFFAISIVGTQQQQAVLEHNPDGMSFVVRKVIPYLRQIGVSDRDIRTITVENPLRFLAGKVTAHA